MGKDRKHKCWETIPPPVNYLCKTILKSDHWSRSYVGVNCGGLKNDGGLSCPVYWCLADSL